MMTLAWPFGELAGRHGAETDDLLELALGP